MRIPKYTALLLALSLVATGAVAQTTKGIGDAKAAAGASKSGGGAAPTGSAGPGGTPGGAEEPAGKGKFTLVNTTDKALSVWLGEAPLTGCTDCPKEVPANGRQEFKGMAVGTRLITIANSTGDRRWGPKEIQVSQEGSEVKVDESSTTGVKLTNYTKDDVVVLLAEKPIGKVAGNGGTGVFADMRPGMNKFSARSASGKLQYSPKYIEVKEGELYDWKLGSAPAGAAAPAPASPAPAK